MHHETYATKGDFGQFTLARLGQRSSLTQLFRQALYLYHFVTPRKAISGLWVESVRVAIEKTETLNFLLSHGHNTRQGDDFHVPYRRLVLASNSIRSYGVNILWNSICKEDIRNIQVT